LTSTDFLARVEEVAVLDLVFIEFFYLELCVNYRWVIASVATGIMLTDCNTPVGISGMSAPPTASIRMTSSSARMSDQAGLLYASSVSGIAVYGGEPLKYLRTITDGVLFPDGIAFNSNKQISSQIKVTIR
jgi:hypothetical protein